MKALKFSLLVVVTSFIFVCCNDIPHIEKGVGYPDVISPIYYIDTFQIKYPRIALVDSIPYIFSLEKLEPFENKENFIQQKGVVPYLTPSMHDDRYSGYLSVYGGSDSKSLTDLACKSVFEDSFDWDVLFLFDETINEIPIYRFVFEPKAFLLTIISTNFHGNMEIRPIHADPDGCYSIPAVFSMDYMLAIMPIYDKYDLKKINKLYCCYVFGENCKEYSCGK
jgi:hypothetical protein